MLDEGSGPLNEIAWMRDQQGQTALHVRGWRNRPEPTALSFYAPDFALTHTEPWLIGERVAWPEFSARDLPALRHRVEPSPVAFDRMHEEILRRLKAQEFRKVVPIVGEDLEYAEPLHASMFPRAFLAYEHQFAYGFSFAGEGLVGITPELLFAVDDGVLQTMALAGTGRVGGPSLMDDDKERREHQIVIDHIVSEIGEWGTPEVGTTTERAYATLKHLYTPIRLELRGPVPDFESLVARLHPTAALGGWPRAAAVSWLEAQQFHYGRGRFGAPFGFRHGSRLRCLVAIRCLQWKGARATLSAGCGVVAGSDSLREWRELKLKRESVYRNLGLEL